MLGSLFRFCLSCCWEYRLLRLGFLHDIVNYAFSGKTDIYKALTSASFSQSSSHASGTPPLFIMQSSDEGAWLQCSRPGPEVEGTSPVLIVYYRVRSSNAMQSSLYAGSRRSVGADGHSSISGILAIRIRATSPHQKEGPATLPECRLHFTPTHKPIASSPPNICLAGCLAQLHSLSLTNYTRANYVR